MNEWRELAKTLHTYHEIAWGIEVFGRCRSKCTVYLEGAGLHLLAKDMPPRRK